MDRQWVWGAALALSAVMTTAQAAETGFYVGAAASRTDHHLDERGGADPLSILQIPIGFSFCSRVPCNILAPLPPYLGGIVGNPVAGFVAARAIPDQVAKDDTDLGWSGTLGYRVNDYFAAEVSYTDFGEAALTQHYLMVSIPELPVPPVTRTSKVNARGPMLSLLGSLPLGESWLLFLRGGVLFVDQEVNTRVTLGATVTSQPMTTSAERDFNDEVISAGVGVEWRFASRWAARLEYQRSDDLENNFSGESRLAQASLGVLFKL